MLQRFDIQRQKQLAWGLLVLIMLAYAVWMSNQAVLRYETFKATAFDLGNLDQVIWNTLHGRFFQFTNQAIDWYGPPTRLAIHFEPIILPLSLLYVFHADPRILLVFQTLALTTGALPVFVLTRKYLAEWPLMAPMMVVAYFLSPALLGLNIFDSHPYALATPFLLYALLALTYRRFGWMLLCCVLACTCKEDVPLTVAMLGVLVIWKYKLPRLGTVLLVGGFLWSFVAFEIIIPHFYPGAQGNNFWYRYIQLGSTPLAAILNILTHPWIIFTTFLTIERFYYVAGLLRSAGFLSLLAPEWLLPALPSIAVNALSTDSLTYSGIFHYNATIIPFVMISAIHGTRRLITTWQVWRGERTIKVRFDQPTVEGTEAQRAAIAGPRYPQLFTSRVVSLYVHIEGWITKVFRALWRFAKRVAQRVGRTGWYSRIAAFTRKTWAAFIVWFSFQWRRFSERMTPLAKSFAVRNLQWVIFPWIAFMLALNLLLIAPALNYFWADHNPGSREQHIQLLLNEIPPNASVSASDDLNPHLSERQYIFVFPSFTDSTHNFSAQYIIVDLDNVLPQARNDVTSQLNQLVRSGQYKVIGHAENVLLLEKVAQSG
ncbi:MAG: DUF2079 domain-containing protein [Ktedonobacteraceae bacterium]